MPKKNYVFDTNVLIHDPSSFLRFQDNDIYIPIYVLEEIDGLKNDLGERGRAAREASRALDNLRIQGSLVNGVKIHENMNDSGILRVYTPSTTEKLSIATEDKKDHLILQSAISIKNTSEYRTILVTMDINMRVRAEALDIQVAPYEYQSVDITNLGNKVINIDLISPEFDTYYKTGFVDYNEEEDLDVNTCVKLICEGDNKRTALGRIKIKDGVKVIKKLQIPRNILGIAPRNMEQQFALDLLLDDEIKLVTIMGTSGVGKTLLALCVGLKELLDGKYSKMLISRPVMPMGKDLGFLPGDINEKMSPYMKPFYDNLDYLAMASGMSKKYNKTIDQLFEQKMIEIEPITYIRGRSIPNQFIIIDETQNINQHEIKTIISRCGENTKLILTGDPDQIDNPYLDKKNNGLSICVQKIKNKNIVGHIALEKGQRSELANIAVEML